MESPDEIKAFIHALRQRVRRILCLAVWIVPDLMMVARARLSQPCRPHSFSQPADCQLRCTAARACRPNGASPCPMCLQRWVLHALEASREALISAAARTGFLFTPTESWCAAARRAARTRKELGLRTVFNTAEKLLRFTEAPYMAVGVFHGTVFEKITNLLIELGVSRGIVVQGMEGSEDLCVDKRTRTYLIQGDTSELFIVILKFMN